MFGYFQNRTFPFLIDVFPQKVSIITKQHFQMEEAAVRKLLTRSFPAPAEELCKTPSFSSCWNHAGALYPGPAAPNEHFPPWPADGTTFVTGLMIAKFFQVCHCQEWFSRLNTQRFFWVSNTVAKNTPSVQSVLNIKLQQQSFVACQLLTISKAYK